MDKKAKLVFASAFQGIRSIMRSLSSGQWLKWGGSY
jgi:hypothetical protein